MTSVILLATERNENQSRELQADNISDIHGAPYVSDRNIVCSKLLLYYGRKHKEPPVRVQGRCHR